MGENKFELPVLETNRLFLRPLTVDDAEDMFAYAQDPLVARYVTWNTHPNVEFTRAYLESVEAAYAKGPHYDWGIEFKGNDQLIGTVGLVHVDEGAKRAEIGYALSRDYWGQGIVTEAAKRIILYTFDELGFYRVEAICDIPNIGSARVMEKIGMTFEGIRRGYICGDDGPRDMKSYAIIRPDFERLY